MVTGRKSTINTSSKTEFTRCWLTNHLIIHIFLTDPLRLQGVKRVSFVTICFRWISWDYGVFLCDLLLWDGRLDYRPMINNDRLVQIFKLARGSVSSSVHGDFKNGLDILINFDRYVADLIVLQIHVRVLLPATAAAFLRCQLHAMRLFAVLQQLDVSVEPFRAAVLFALVQLLSLIHI